MKGNCNHYRSPFHWVNNCNIRKLGDRIRELELQLSNKEQNWANNTEVHVCDDETNTTPTKIKDACGTKIKSLSALYDWFIDSGPSAHVMGNRNLLT